jgi:hypothetical protein
LKRNLLVERASIFQLGATRSNQFRPDQPGNVHALFL